MNTQQGHQFANQLFDFHSKIQQGKTAGCLLSNYFTMKVRRHFQKYKNMYFGEFLACFVLFDRRNQSNISLKITLFNFHYLGKIYFSYMSRNNVQLIRDQNSTPFPMKLKFRHVFGEFQHALFYFTAKVTQKLDGKFLFSILIIQTKLFQQRIQGKLSLGKNASPIDVYFSRFKTIRRIADCFDMFYRLFSTLQLNSQKNLLRLLLKLPEYYVPDQTGEHQSGLEENLKRNFRFLTGNFPI